MLLELFVIGSFWFWALIIAEVAWVFGFVKYERGGPAFAGLVVLALVLWLLGDFNVFAWIWANPWELLAGVGVYLGLGVVWSLAKWRLVCTEIRDKFYEVRTKFLEDNNLGDAVPTDWSDRWLEELNNTTWSDREDSWSRRKIRAIKDVIPLARNHKNYIMFWMGYWPISMFWFFLHDMIEKLFQRIYDFFAGMFQRIANGVFSGIPDEIRKDGE
jgi:hypothetical protein